MTKQTKIINCVGKALLSFVISLALVLTNMPVYADMGTAAIQLSIHYQRYDEDYAQWNLWMWPKDMDGAAYKLDGEDAYGKTAVVKMTIPANIDKVGIIVRKGEWEAKDIEADRYIDLTRMVNYELDVYLMQDTEQIFYGLDEVAVNPKIKNAHFISSTEIAFLATAEIASNTSINVTENGTSIAVSNVKYSSAKKGIIMLESNVQMDKTYELAIDGFEIRDISVSKLFDTEEFESAYFYSGVLGADYTAERTVFTLWAPTASAVSLVIYEDGYMGKLKNTCDMARIENGAWTYTLEGDQNGLCYNYKITVNSVSNIATDLYANAVGVNGIRSIVVDLAATNPVGWEDDKRYEQNKQTDAVIYEVHVRDLSMDDDSHIQNKGKFLGFTETGTTNGQGASTGVDSIAELGVTHIHLLPSFDYHTIDETNLSQNKFNWGYDPQNYNVPEGSYSTDPYNGALRINEFKQMVQSIHNKGMGVVMDVVYNHTYTTAESSFSRTVPYYYYRANDDGTYANGSGCGNETASERAMMNRYIVDSVVYWATEYHIDGFRFDLMGLHDIKLMEDIRAALDEIDPSIIMYGEGWNAGGSPLKKSEAALKANAGKMSERIAFFSDDIRDALKGSVFDEGARGFVSNDVSSIETVKFGIVASVEHPQIKYALTNSGAPWAIEPTQTITYASAHDNLSLWDKLLASTNLDESADKEELVKMNKLCAAIIFTSQGIPFFQAGEEFARTKNGDENSFQSPDSVNKLDWSRKSDFMDLFTYYKGLISLRKAHPAFRMATTAQIQSSISFMDFEPSIGMIGYTLSGKYANDEWSEMAVLFNSSKEPQTAALHSSGWVVVVNGEQSGTERLGFLKGSSVTVPPQSAYVLVDSHSFGYSADQDENMYQPTIKSQDKETGEPSINMEDVSGSTTPIGFIAGAAIAIAGLGTGLFVYKTRNSRRNKRTSLWNKH